MDKDNADWMKKRLPFGVVGSNVVLEEGGHRVRGRRYPWGTINIENKVKYDALMSLYKTILDYV